MYEVAEGSAAEAAGIKKGDIITKFDGMSVSSSSDLIDKMSYYKVGETVTVEVQTANGGDYETREVEVTLQEGGNAAQDETDAQEAPSDGQDDEFGTDGNMFRMIPDLDSSNEENGVF